MLASWLLASFEPLWPDRLQQASKYDKFKNINDKLLGRTKNHITFKEACTLLTNLNI